MTHDLDEHNGPNGPDEFGTRAAVRRARAVRERARCTRAAAWQLTEQARNSRARSTATLDRTEAVRLESTAARLGVPAPLLHPERCR